MNHKYVLCVLSTLSYTINAMDNPENMDPWEIVSTYQDDKYVRSADYNASSNQLLVDSQEKTNLINLDNQKTIQLEHCEHFKPVFHPAHNYILTKPYKNEIAVYNCTGEKRTTIEYPSKGRRSVAQFDNSGSKILATSDHATALLWDLEGKKITECKLDEGAKICKFFPSDDNLLFISNASNIAKIWDIRGKKITNYNQLQNLDKIDVQPQGTCVVYKIKDDSKLAVLCDLRNNSKTNLVVGAGIQSAKFNNSGTHILTNLYGNGCTVLLWDIQNIEEQSKKYNWPDPTTRLRSTNLCRGKFHPNENQVITYGGRTIFRPENNFTLWDLDGNQQTKIDHEKKIYSAKFDQTGEYIISKHEDNIVIVWQKNYQKDEQKLDRECCICFDNKNLIRMACNNCKKGSERICTICKQEVDKCPICNL